MKRRNFVSSFCAAITAFSGCAAFEQPDTVQIGLAEIVNLDESSEHDVHVHITENGDSVYDRHHHLPKQTGTVPPSVVVDDEIPDKQGQYEVQVTVDSKPEPEQMDVPSMTEGDCTNVIVLIRSDSWVGLTATERCYGNTPKE